jgi:hypothetical protein
MTEAKIENLMAPTWTKASLVRRAFKAGPRRKSDLKLDDIEEAVLAAYSAFLDLRKEMKKTELPALDVRAALVFMAAVYEGRPFNGSPGALVAIPDTLRRIPEMLNDAERYAGEGGMDPLGVAFWQRDNDARAKTRITTWVQSWRVDPRISRAAEATREEFEELDGEVPKGGLAFTFPEI